MFWLAKGDEVLEKVIRLLLQYRDREWELVRRGRMVVLLANLLDETQRKTPAELRALIRDKAADLDLSLDPMMVDAIVAAMITTPKGERGRTARIATALFRTNRVSGTTLEKMLAAFRGRAQSQGLVRDPSDAKLLPWYEPEHQAYATAYALRLISRSLPPYVNETLRETYQRLVSMVMSVKAGP